MAGVTGWPDGTPSIKVGPLGGRGDRDIIRSIRARRLGDRESLGLM